MGFYKYIRWLSLDIVLGAIFFLYYLEDLYSVHLSGNVYIALGSAIWLIYTADHLIDARKLDVPSSPRHAFHQKYYRILIIAGGVVLSLALVNVAQLPVAIIRNGLMLSACCVGYLLMVYLFPGLWAKEILVALVYALGILLAPITLLNDISDTEYLIVGQLFLVALLNLMVFSYYDFNNDRTDGFGSLAVRLGSVFSFRMIHGLAWISLALNVGIWLATGYEIQLIFVLMTSLLYLLILFPSFFRVNERFRTIGDGVFYIPLLFLL